MPSSDRPTSVASPLDPFDALPDPAALLGPDGALIAANAAFRQAFRHAIGPKRAPWGRVAPPPFEDDLRCFEAAAPDGRRYEWRERALSDGRRLAIARDVTARVRAADEAARAKTVLFATLTHELRTPLNGVLGMAQLLGEGPLSEAQRAQLAAVRQSGEHLLDLIGDILDYARLEAGRPVMEVAPFSPEAVAQEVAELLSPRAFAKGIGIFVVVAPDAPARVRGDAGRFRQILFNLAGNAVKFTESGGVRLEIAAGQRCGEGHARLRISVRDTGPGIPPERQAAIFEEFAQVEASHAQRFGGTGLGLAIVKRLAQAFGGEIGLDSHPGAGALFWAELPLPEEPPTPQDEPPPRLEGFKIAVAAENAFALGALRAIIEGLGGACVAVPTTLPNQRFDALLVDVGRADWRALAQAAAPRPVVALVAQEDRAAIEAARAAGLQHYALKPVRRAAFAQRLRAAAHGAGRPSVEDERGALAGPLNLRALLAEDNPVNALLARAQLSKAGCSVEVVGDGEEAVAAALARPFDVILLDLRMPVLDGFGAARRLRAAGVSAAIVALTANTDASDREAALAAGMDAFLTKPIEPSALVAALQRLSKRAQPPRLG